ncbi:Nicotinamide-nucleotide adenylyltransferase, partial [Tolypocladium paradoxum]
SIFSSATASITPSRLWPCSPLPQKKGLAPAQHRVEMCKLAAQNTSKWLMVDPWEAESLTYIPTARVLDHVDYEINEVMGGIECTDGTRKRARIVLLAGLDLIQTMSTPGVWDERDLDHILHNYGVFALERTGTEIGSALANLKQWEHNIHIIRQVVTNDISSIKVRLLLKRDMSIDYLIPEDVISYIYEHNLYRHLDMPGDSKGKDIANNNTLAEWTTKSRRKLYTHRALTPGWSALKGHYLVGGLILCAKHGFLKSTGWRFLIILALARINGSALELATINDPANENLYIGWAALNGLGLDRLIHAAGPSRPRLRLHQPPGTRRRHAPLRHPIEILVIVGIILLIVGGTESDFFVVDGEPKVVCLRRRRRLLCLETLLALSNQGYVAQGEHRIIVAVIICLPSVLVRLACSCIVVFGGVGTSRWLYLGMLVIMGMIVLICDVLGFTLDEAPPKPQSDPEMESEPRSRHRRRRGRRH